MRNRESGLRWQLRSILSRLGAIVPAGFRLTAVPLIAVLVSTIEQSTAPIVVVMKDLVIAYSPVVWSRMFQAVQS